MSPDYKGSLTRRKHPDKPPITGVASPVKSVQPSDFSQTGSLGRGGNPLKSFSVPEPPLQQSSLPSSTPKHIGKTCTQVMGMGQCSMNIRTQVKGLGS